MASPSTPGAGAKTSQETSQENIWQNMSKKDTNFSLTFDNLNVSAPDLGRVQVKTLARTIINTFGFDQATWIVQKLLRPIGIVSQPKQKTLLHQFSGCVEPGEMLLVLGRPGSGCSTFLRATANRSVLNITGHLSYSGINHKEFYERHRRETIYLPEQDQHIPSLTVRQTLAFALHMSLPRQQRDHIDEKTNSLAAMFGLQHALDTPVASVSGGERKRVSIAEVLASGSSVQCFDNSTRGLDSSTALDFVKALRTLTDVSQKTTLATLYQAGESTYQHFDKVILLDSGYQVYFGPINDAKPYFENLGFISEPGQTTSEFLSMVTDPETRQTKPGSIAASLHSAEALAKQFQQSSAFSQVQTTLKTQTEQQKDQPTVVASSKVNLSYPEQVFACLRREVQLINGRRQVYYQKWINCVILCLVVGSEYFQISANASGAFTREGVIFYAIIANAWMQYPELFDAHTNRPILERQSSLGMYRPSAVALARVIIDIPMIALQHGWFMVAYYFLAHNTVKYTAGDFFFFYFVLCLSTINFANLLRMFAYYVPSVEDCFRFGGIASTTTVYFAGFLIPVSKMKPTWAWLHYISPPRYTYEALLTNEFHRFDLTCEPSDLIPQSPSASLVNQICPVRGARAGQASVPGLQYVESFGFAYGHRWRNVGLLFAFAAVYILVGLVGSEIMQFSSQGGTPVIYTKEYRKKSVKDSEEKPGNNSASSSSDIERSAAAQDTAAASTGHQGPSLLWEDVGVTIGDKSILRNISGFVKPGQLAALCGTSGAGKTTLLGHLAKTNPTGNLTGTIEFGNKPQDNYFKKISGFAQQSDMHDGTATVREALEFSALLRQPSYYTREEKLAYVDSVLDILNLRQLQDALIGDADSGLGVEVTKRITVAIELVARPKILFADEPTSGLDSQGAMAIVGYLKRLADQGQAILITIHQPSASIFAMFDTLLALSSNGDQIYFGPVKQVLPYFEGHGATVPKDVNPAEFVLETIGAGIGDKEKNSASAWATTWADSPESQEMKSAMASIKTQTHGWDKSEETDEFSTSILTQSVLLTNRMLLNQWRKPAYIYSKIWVHVIQAILIGFTFFQLKTSPTDLQSRAFGAFALIFLVNTIVNPVLGRFFGQRLLWEAREGPSKTYGWVALCNASFLAEMPAVIVTGTIYYLMWYFLTGLPLGSAAGYTFLMVMIYEVYEMTLGLVVIAFSPDLKAAGLMLVFIVTLFNWFNGVVVPYDQIQVFWRYWLYYINPLTYLFGGMITAVNENVHVECDQSDLFSFPPPSGQSCQEYAGDWARQVSANLTNPTSTLLCHVCELTSGNQYLAKYNLHNGQLANNKWFYLVIFLAFTLVNIGCFYLLTWARRVKKCKLSWW